MVLALLDLAPANAPLSTHLSPEALDAADFRENGDVGIGAVKRDGGRLRLGEAGVNLGPVCGGRVKRGTRERGSRRHGVRLEARPEGGRVLQNVVPLGAHALNQGLGLVAQVGGLKDGGRGGRGKPWTQRA